MCVINGFWLYLDCLSGLNKGYIYFDLYRNKVYIYFDLYRLHGWCVSLSECVGLQAPPLVVKYRYIYIYKYIYIIYIYIYI